MHRLAKAFGIAVVFATADCEGAKLTYSQTDTVEIPGGESDKQKLATAQTIGDELWYGPLKPYLVQSVPGVSAADLEQGLELTWGVSKRVSIFTGETKSTPKVVIKCTYASDYNDYRVAKVVAACKHLVAEAVKKRYGG